MALAEQIVEKLPQDSILRSLTRTELNDFLGIDPRNTRRQRLHHRTAFGATENNRETLLSRG